MHRAVWVGLVAAAALGAGEPPVRVMIADFTGGRGVSRGDLRAATAALREVFGRDAHLEVIPAGSAQAPEMVLGGSVVKRGSALTMTVYAATVPAGRQFQRVVRIVSGDLPGNAKLAAEELARGLEAQGPAAESIPDFPYARYPAPALDPGLVSRYFGAPRTPESRHAQP